MSEYEPESERAQQASLRGRAIQAAAVSAMATCSMQTVEAIVDAVLGVVDDVGAPAPVHREEGKGT